jgi:hypothetical protein
MKYCIGLATVFLLLRCGPGLAQDFNPEWRQFPNAYLGDNIQLLARKLDVKKAEFESTAEFENRLGAIAPAGRQYLFLCSEIPFKLDYDADTQQFVFTRISYDVDIEVAKYKKNGQPYVGENSFGARAQIEKVQVTQYGIMDQDLDSQAGVVLRFPFASNEAQQLKKDLRVALLVELSPHRHFGKSYNSMTSPYLFKSSYAGIPTIGNRLEYASVQYDIVAEVKRVVLYRHSNRAILAIAAPIKRNEQAEANSSGQ